MTTSIQVLLEAAKSLDLPINVEDDTGAVATLTFGDYKHRVINNFLGVNYDNEVRLLRDKFRCYQYLQGKVKQPETRMYLDPEYSQNSKFSVGQITQKIAREFSWPVIVKRNSGTQKQNVYLCQDKEEVKQALKKIYSKKQLEYDHVALAQTYIKPSMEMRVLVYEGKVEFGYPTKGFAKLNLTTQEDEAIRLLCLKIYQTLGVRLMGIDLIRDMGGEWWFLEANANPIFSGYMRRNPASKAVYFLYRKILYALKSRYHLV